MLTVCPWRLRYRDTLLALSCLLAFIASVKRCLRVLTYDRNCKSVCAATFIDTFRIDVVGSSETLANEIQEIKISSFTTTFY